MVQHRLHVLLALPPQHSISPQQVVRVFLRGPKDVRFTPVRNREGPYPGHVGHVLANALDMGTPGLLGVERFLRLLVPFQSHCAQHTLCTYNTRPDD